MKEMNSHLIMLKGNSHKCKPINECEDISSEKSDQF